MLGEITHLQAIIDDLTVLTTDPHKLPPASEQVRNTWAHTHTNIARDKDIKTTTKTTKTTTQHVGWCGWEDTNVKTRTGTSAGVGAAAGADWVYWETVLVEVMEGKQRYTTQQSHNTTTAAMLQWWPAAATLGWSDAITQNTQMGGCGGADVSEGWRGSGEMKDRKWKSSASKI